MLGPFHRRGLALFSAAVLGAVLAGTVALAVIPDTDGVIHGCRNKNTGAIRVIDYPSRQCNSKETPLDWNQTGPQGPAGPQGPGAGLTFTAGALDPTGVATDYNTRVSLSLPAGQYRVSGQVTVWSGTRARISCVIDDQFNTVLSVPGIVDITNTYGTIPVQTAVDLDSPVEVRLRCKVDFSEIAPPPGGSPIATLREGVLIATQVGAVDDQSS